MIDPSISLQVKPIQLEDPLTQMGKGLNLLALKNQAQMAPIQMQAAQQQLAAGQMENQQRQMDLQDQQTMRQAYMDAGGDMDKFQQLVTQRGASPKAITQIQQQILAHKEATAKLNQTELENQQKTTAAIGSSAQTLLQLPDEQTRAQQWPAVRQQMMEQGHAKPEQIPEQYPGQQWVEVHRNAAMTAQQIQEQVLKERQDKRDAESNAASIAQKNAQAGLEAAQTPGAKAKSDIEVVQAKALKDMTRSDWQTRLDATVPDKNSPLYKRTLAAVQMELNRSNLKGADDAISKAADQLGKTETAVATAQATAPIKINVATATAQGKADAAGLTDDDYQRAGELYARTGVMPAMGRDSITRGKIVHAGNEWARDNGLKPSDLVTMQAAYAGDKESLKKFQSQRDQIVSFEQTAGKNLDVFLDAASKIPDMGSPWLNRPLRSLDQNMVGAANMAAVNAARQIANNEIAKVTSGGGLGGVLSDSARKEVADYNPKDATFAQTLAVAKVLKQDMANRHQSMDSTLSDIKSRIGGGNPSDAGGAATHRFNPATGKIEVIK